MKIIITLMALIFLLSSHAVFGAFVDNNDGTVTDTATGLMWQKCSMGQHWNAGTGGCYDSAVTHIWQSALQECEDLSLAGYDDWRLPDRNELQSIVDYSCWATSINKSYFPNTVSSSYWSSTTYAGHNYVAWLVYFYYGNVSYYYKSSNYYARCVRGGQ